MGKISAVSVEKKVVDVVPTWFKEPGKLDRVFRVGNNNDVHYAAKVAH